MRRKDHGVIELDEDIVERKGLNWPTAIALVVLHAGAIAALFMFSWSRLAVSAGDRTGSRLVACVAPSVSSHSRSSARSSREP